MHLDTAQRVVSPAWPEMDAEAAARRLALFQMSDAGLVSLPSVVFSETQRNLTSFINSTKAVRDAELFLKVRIVGL